MPTHYLNQWWHIIIWNPGINFIKIPIATICCLKKMHLKMSFANCQPFLFRPQCVKQRIVIWIANRIFKLILTQNIFIPLAQRSCWGGGVYWFPSVRPSVRPASRVRSVWIIMGRRGVSQNSSCSSLILNSVFIRCSVKSISIHIYVPCQRVCFFSACLYQKDISVTQVTQWSWKTFW